ncbi:MAG: hypothetical protein M1833_001900 [Piccolia ochrophora]|nr:MAG: hypothetical protein M1833_001900 [Piccolia ochrophora]
MISLTSIILPPLLIVICIPLAFLAVVTSVIAFSALLLRVLVVYVELGLVLFHTYLLSSSQTHKPYLHLTTSGVNITSKSASRSPSSPISTFSLPSYTRRPKRRTSSNTSLPPDQSSPSSARTSRNPLPASKSHTGLTLTRDFEGVGGWRLTDYTAADDAADAQWTALNSRLELPAGGDRKRRHRRSLTSGSAPVLTVAGDGQKTPRQEKQSPEGVDTENGATRRGSRVEEGDILGAAWEGARRSSSSSTPSSASSGRGPQPLMMMGSANE